MSLYFCIKKAIGFCSVFKSIFWETYLWARWFYGKKCKIRKGNLCLTKNWWRKNKISCNADNHDYICHIRAKGFVDSDINEAVIDKISNFQEIAPNFTFHIFTKILFFKVWLETDRPTASTLWTLWQWCKKNLLFHFCQLWPLKELYFYPNPMSIIIINNS